MLGDVLSNAENVLAKGRLGPGQMVVADLEVRGDDSGTAQWQGADRARTSDCAILCV